MKKFNPIALLIPAAALCLFSTAQAAQLNGALTFNGTVTLDAPSVSVANQVLAWHYVSDIGNPYVSSSSGDFVGFVTLGPPGTVIFATPWSFTSGPVAPFWQVNGFTFNLTSSKVDSRTASTLSVSGSGVVSGHGFDPTPGVWSFTTQDPAAGGVFSFSAGSQATSGGGPVSGGDTATIGFWANKNGQALIKALPNSPALGNWLASNFPCLFGNLSGRSNSVVAAQFATYKSITGQKTYAQVMAVALAAYVTNSNLAGNVGGSYGFHVSSTGTGAKLFNVGSNGAAIGLTNNNSYTVLALLTTANANCPWNSAAFNALNSIFDGINTQGDIP